jgi:L,D-transpeptidase catalytic domain
MLVIRIISVLLQWVLLVISVSCTNSETAPATPPVFKYDQFKDSVLKSSSDTVTDLTNIFDAPSFTPGKDSLHLLLERMDTMWKREAALMARLDTLKKGIKQGPGFSEEEMAVIRENIRMVDSFLLARDSADRIFCREKDCMVYAEIDKSTQRLYLYVMGELKDTFKVSTGKGKKYETPEMNRHPEGPVLTKYTSKKFPGGNYMGLGNMPYAVFISNGYAIHGTTPGNYAKLGNRASHGCIRLHPDNAKVFNALVKTVGLRQTWVSVKDSLP